MASRKAAARGVAKANTKVPAKRATRQESAGPNSSAPANDAPTTQSNATAKAAATSSKRLAQDDDEAEAQNSTSNAHDRKKRKLNAGPDVPKTSTKRKAAEESGQAAPAKRFKGDKAKVMLTQAPAQQLAVYVFGANTGGELGLGPDSISKTVTRPRLNPFIHGAVQIATGGMHCAALTYDNKILTWGVNDHGALGRDTVWDGGLKDMKNGKGDVSDSDSDGGRLNPKEATPTAVDAAAFPHGTVFSQLAAGDNATFALTNEGLVYGWGTFRSGDGILGFSKTTKIQSRPVLIKELKKVTKLVAGSNHMLALTATGTVYAWGSGEQHQLGRRIIERNRLNGLVPCLFGLPKGIVDIGSGSDHSFAVHSNGKVYSWGTNTFGETGITHNAGQHDASILRPMVVESLQGQGHITCITGGNHHSIAVTDQGACLVWGQVENCALGLRLTALPGQCLIRDTHGRPRIITAATRVPGLQAAFAAAGTDHSLVVGTDGKAYSCGFSAECQTGQGTDEDVETVTWIDNTAVRGKTLVWAGAGGQYSVVAGPGGAGSAVA